MDIEDDKIPLDTMPNGKSTLEEDTSGHTTNHASDVSESDIDQDDVDSMSSRTSSDEVVTHPKTPENNFCDIDTLNIINEPRQKSKANQKNQLHKVLLP